MLEERPMRGPRCNRILAGAALVLVLGIPFDVVAQEGTESATAKGALPAAQISTEKSSAPVAPAHELPATSVDPAMPPSPPAATEQGAASDPLASQPESTAAKGALPAAQISTEKSSTPAAPAPQQPATGIDAPATPPATEQAALPDPLASLDPADRAVAEKIRDLLAVKPDRLFASANERTAVEVFYRRRNLAPLWLDKGVENTRAKAAIARLKQADADGLDVNDYRTPNFDGLSPDALAEADVKLTQTVLTFARHLQAGRFPYNRVSRNNIQLPQVPPEPAAVFAKMADAEDVGKALDEFSPPHPAYQKLRAKLAEMRSSTTRAEQIADGPPLKHNAKASMQDPRVPALRARLGVSDDASDLTYDPKLAAAVREFQQANELPATGNLDARTVKALNDPGSDRRVDLIIANMERWRWYPRDLGADHVTVNQPDFTLKVMHDGAQVWATKVVIGGPSPNNQTPLLSETMKSITVNPTWNVPPSILYGDYMPAMARDPTVLYRMGLDVAYGSDGSMHVSQPPGGNSVLGRLRFNFPNRFLVYQHDTNEKYMFANDVRAASHGCVRVQDPAKYAYVVLNIARPNEHWTVEKVARMFGGPEQDILLQPAQIWVHLTYQSAFVDDNGKLQTRRDIYGLDRRTLAAIKSERVMIEPEPEGSKPEQRPEQAVASTSSRRKAATRRSASSSPVSFFFSLFNRPVQTRAMRPPRSVY